MSFMPYARPGKGATNNDTGNRNPRYKGKNYDPNHHEKKRFQRNQQNRQNHQTDNPKQWNPFESTLFGSTSNPLFSSHQSEQQPQMPLLGIQQQQTQQLPLTFVPIENSPSSLSMQFLEHFSQEVKQKLTKDIQGDVRICDCHNPGGPQCFHTMAALYQNQLVQSGQIKHDIVSLLTDLMAKDDGVQRGILREFLAKNPQTPLRTILETMGRERTLPNPHNTGGSIQFL
ncbi:hypothetical protein GQX73_g5008 [Xylaria multiplex]|uniref:SWIM-type domain-containing protein n=1 Tax=Xylaria multiplex TaxID=323545 RepID=A0A7C8IP15_9PEZI|nr:hypothetical protein GQX73_g5008 [Xylaria multiplex]